MNFETYYNNGWGLHPETIEIIYDIIKNNEINTILEFGSGGSTKFFIDARQELNKNYTLDSFDHTTLCYNGQIPEYLNLIQCDIVTCNDEEYNEMFASKIFKPQCFSKTDDIYNPVIKNSVYSINENLLKESYDLVLIDGPHGNGRNLLFFYLKARMKKNSIIIIDDYFHYDFLEKCSLFFEYEVLHKNIVTKDLSNKGYAILKIN